MTSILSKIENNKKRRILKKIAQAEYEASRGFQHLALLKEARERIITKINKYAGEISILSSELDEIQENTRKRLRVTLEKYIIKSHITEIPGIGNSLGSKLLNSVYKNSLHDLWHASAYNGIGQTKQQLINRWVSKYDQLVPVLLNQDFPGKNSILSETSDRIGTLQTELKKWEDIRLREEKRLDQVAKEIERLEIISADDFINARVDHQGNLTQIDEFIKGIFSVWEIMPEWFKEAIQDEDDV